MNRHYTAASLARLFDGPADEAEAKRAMHHLARCQSCLAAAADYLAQRKDGPPLRAAEPRAALVTFVQEEARSAVEVLEARVWLADLRELSPVEQIRKVRSVAALRSLPVFDAILSEASTVGRSDPFLGESTAGVALAVVDHLPESQCPQDLKSDLRGKVLTEVGNCRRIAADWRGSAEALATARRHLAQGTGDAGLEARLLSIQASLYTDTGNFEKALSCASRAVKIYRDLEDRQGVAHNLVKEAGCLLAAGQPREATEKASSALERIPPSEIRLLALARLALVESLITLRRPLEALSYFRQAEPLCNVELGLRLRALYYEAWLLDALGQLRESEKLFRTSIKSFFENELYKDAFIAMLTLFECFCRRGALTKAAALCEAAIEATSEAGEACNDQIRRAWEDLLAAVRVRQLSEEELVHARRFLIRNWSMPVAGAVVLPRPETLSVRAGASPEPPAPPPIPAAEELQSFDLQTALASYERQFIEAALKKTGGNISEASRLVGLSRNGLKNKIRQYGL